MIPIYADFLIAHVKYPFNQATSYHMRVGRRYNGHHKGEFELKRSLVRWDLPQLPKNSRIVAASVDFWVEAHLSDSPLVKPNSPLAKSDSLLVKQERQAPLHLYLYPLSASWGPGQGGINQDSFSRAAPGEVSWNEAKSGIKNWNVPGALHPTQDEPIGLSLIDSGNKQITITGERLRRYLDLCFQQQRSFDLLLKLDNHEEDRWGTEVGLFTSQFGDPKDITSKRPRLTYDIELPYPAVNQEEEFILEPGEDYLLPVVEHPDREILLSTEILSHDQSSLAAKDSRSDQLNLQIAPSMWIRGGKADKRPEDAEWISLNQQMPTQKRWDWSQLKLVASPHQIQLGQTLSINLLETWIQPGPKEQQLPELVLVAPSGKVHRINGEYKGDFQYQIKFKPDLPGLWKYGWSFLPMHVNQPGSHQGEGLFYVDIPSGESEERELRAFAKRLEAVSQEIRSSRRSAYQYQRNQFIRWASAYAQKGAHEKQLSDELINRVREPNQ